MNESAAGILERREGCRMLTVNDSITIPDAEFDWSYARSGGPGGQNVNKVSSKAVLRWDVRASPSVPPHVKDRLVALNRRRGTTQGGLVLTAPRHPDQDPHPPDCLD